MLASKTGKLKLQYYYSPLLFIPSIKAHQKSLNKFNFSSKHPNLILKKTGIRNSCEKIFLGNLHKIRVSTVKQNLVKNRKSPYSSPQKTMLKLRSVVKIGSENFARRLDVDSIGHKKVKYVSLQSSV